MNPDDPGSGCAETEQVSESGSLSTEQRLAMLLEFVGEPARFWKTLCRETLEAMDATGAVCYVDPNGTHTWQCVGVWPAEPPEARKRALHDGAPALARDAGKESEGWLFRPLPKAENSCAHAVIQPLPGGKARLCLIAITAPPESQEKQAGLRDQLRQLASAAPAFQLQHTLQRARVDVGQFSNILDLLALVNGQEKFIATSMLLVNELSSRLQADRVSLGWLRKGYIRIQVVSHMENFSKHMEGVQELEAAMEEAFEQNTEVLWPESPDEASTPLISRDHQKFAESQTAGHVVSVPLRKQEHEPAAVLTLERKSTPFEERELRWLRLCADQIAPRLIQVEENDVWFGRRWARRLMKTARGLLGVEHTGWKALGLVGLLALLFLLFGSWPHRLRGDFELHSQTVQVLPAPFDGFIEQAFVEKGVLVAEGEILLQMDTRELLIEQASALADLSRYTREMEKARAARELADMQMASAMAEQAQARLDLVTDRLERARIMTPFTGAVVDGDLLERSGAPVRQGDVLFRVASWQQMRVRADFRESDIDYLSPGAEARLIFASRPEDPVHARVLRVEPMAQTRENRNVFVAHLAIEHEEEPWWRPGMTGTVRVDAGKRRPIWLLTRRTLDYFRLRYGW